MKSTFHVKGMHCRSCEILLHDELMEVQGVQNVRASFQKGEVIIDHSSPVAEKHIIDAIGRAGYTVGLEEKIPFFSHDQNAYLQIVCAAIGIFFISIILDETGFLHLLDISSQDFTKVGVVFAAGITAGISTCAALIGGLVFSISMRYAKDNPSHSGMSRFIPHVFFNLGRIAGFIVFGGLLGLMGSAVQFSLGMTAFVSILVGAVMLILGFQLTGLFPRLARWSITLPPQLAERIGITNVRKNQYSHIRTTLAGAGTFFLPCGFTQMMQVYAISTGSFFAGALVMGMFAIGTSVGLLLIGSITSFYTNAAMKPVYRIAGVIIVVLACINITNGARLAGISLPALGDEIQAQGKVQIENGIQVVDTTFTSASDIQPNIFTVKKDMAVKMRVNVQDEGSGCMGSFAIPGLTRKVDLLKKGSTLVYEFMPTKIGQFDITCAMGVPRGKIIVI